MKCVLEALEIDEAAAGKLATEGSIAPRKIHGSSVDALEKAMVNQSFRKQKRVMSRTGNDRFFQNPEIKLICHLSELN